MGSVSNTCCDGGGTTFVSHVTKVGDLTTEKASRYGIIRDFTTNVNCGKMKKVRMLGPNLFLPDGIQEEISYLIRSFSFAIA